MFRAINQIQINPKFATVPLAIALNKDELLVQKEVQLLFDEAVTKPNTQAQRKENKLEINLQEVFSRQV